MEIKWGHFIICQRQNEYDNYTYYRFCFLSNLLLISHPIYENFAQNVFGGSENHGLSVAISYCQ